MTTVYFRRNNETGSNAYKDVYAFDNRGPLITLDKVDLFYDDNITGNKGGGNPEDSTVETLFYSRHWLVAFDHTCV